jgi:hypothetical protein
MNKNSFKFRRPSSMLLTAGMAVCLASPTMSKGALLLGTLAISSGSSNVVISTDAITFGMTAGTFDVATSSTGGFSSLSGSGLIKNIDNPPYATGVIFPTPDFMTFTIAPNITITLTELLAGTDSSAQCFVPAAAGQNCTPNVPNMAPYNLNNTSATASTASFSVLGIEVDSLTGTSVPISGLIQATFASQNYQQLLAIVNTPGGSVTTSYSGTFVTSAVPEPGTGVSLALGAFGLAGLISFQRRRSEKQKASV